MKAPVGLRRVAVLSLVMLFIGGMALSGCTWFGGKSKPAWVDGATAEFSSSQYLLGQGHSSDEQHDQ